MARAAVLALVCWFAVSVPAIVIIGRLIGSSGRTTPTPPLVDAPAKELEEAARFAGEPAAVAHGGRTPEDARSGAAAT